MTALALSSLYQKSNNKFIEDVRAAIRDNEHARAFFFPPNRKARRKMNLRLGREIGYGLESDDDIGGLYSILVVAFSFDSTGVVIDAKEFFEAIREGISKKGEDEDSLYP